MRNVLATDIKNQYSKHSLYFGDFSNRFGYPDV